MRLDEISDEDKSFLTLRGIRFDFVDDYNNVVLALSIMGKSIHRRQLLKDDVVQLVTLISIFLNQGFNITDPDVINATDIYSKLSEIKNKL
jgi:hypothetical protein